MTDQPKTTAMKANAGAVGGVVGVAAALPIANASGIIEAITTLFMYGVSLIGTPPAEVQTAVSTLVSAAVVALVSWLFVYLSPANVVKALVVAVLSMGMLTSTVGCNTTVGRMLTPSVRPASMPAPQTLDESWNAALIGYTDAVRLVNAFAATACPRIDAMGVRQCDPDTSTADERAFIRWAQGKRMEAEAVIGKYETLAVGERSAQAALLDAIAKLIVAKHTAATTTTTGGN